MDVPIEAIRVGLATHYHIDHAGCAQELKRRGIRLIVTPEQIEAIPAMTRWIKPTDNYVGITGDDNLVLPIDQSSRFPVRSGHLRRDRTHAGTFARLGVACT